MLERLKYQNHLGEVIDFGREGVFVNTNDLHDYKWSTTTRGDRISAFSRDIQTRTLPIVIMCDTEESGISKRNKLFETFEKDVLAVQHGKIIIGDYYFRCYVTKSTKSDYQNSKQYISLKLTLSTDFPYWVKESQISYSTAQIAADGYGLDYSFDYPIDYTCDLDFASLKNPNFVASNFKLIIFGACSNPEVIIAGHCYKVNCNVGVNEYLTIDSTTKRIFLTRNDGTIVNKFSARDKTSYVFEKIPSGTNDVTWLGDFAFDIVLLDERSEPTWT